MNCTPHEHVAMTCAQIWAGAHAGHAYDGKQFGVAVMNVYLAAKAAASCKGNAPAMAAALAALSIPVETLQALGQIAQLAQRLPKAHAASGADASKPVQ